MTSTPSVCPISKHKSECDGQGHCLTECNRRNCIHNHTITFYGSSTTYYDDYCRGDCVYNCSPKPYCHNYQLCGSCGPEYGLSDRWLGDGLCENCRSTIGKVEFHDRISDECPICRMDEVVLIACGKTEACMECWKRPFFNIHDLIIGHKEITLLIDHNSGSK